MRTPSADSVFLAVVLLALLPYGLWGAFVLAWASDAGVPAHRWILRLLSVAPLFYLVCMAVVCGKPAADGRARLDFLGIGAALAMLCVVAVGGTGDFLGLWGPLGEPFIGLVFLLGGYSAFNALSRTRGSAS